MTQSSSFQAQEVQTQKSPPQKLNPFYIIVGFLVISTFATGAFFAYQKFLKKALPGKEQTQVKQKEEEGKTVVALPQGEIPAFAEYVLEKSKVTPSLPKYEIKINELANLAAIQQVGKTTFTPSQVQALENAGFFVIPGATFLKDPNQEIGETYDEMAQIIKGFGGPFDMYERKPENAIFVSSDLLLHTYHVFIDRTFQYIEEVKFHPVLTKLTNNLFEKTLKNYNQEKDQSLKESFGRLTIFFLVPKVILETVPPRTEEAFLPPEQERKILEDDKAADTSEKIKNNLAKYQNQLDSKIYQLASQELDLVLEATKLVPSPTFGEFRKGQQEDYTQFKPRSHYTKNAYLRSYFRAMMWYGRQSFRVSSTQLVQDGVVQTFLLKNLKIDNEPTFKLWEKIYLPTVFYVGRSDDLTFYDYQKLLEEIFGSEATVSNLSDLSNLRKFQIEAAKLADPKIMSEVIVDLSVFEKTKEELQKTTKGFRFMGQRFIPDSYIFSSLTQGQEKPDEETGQSLPSTPTSLMVASVLGSSQADNLLNDWVKDNAPNSDKVIAKVENRLKQEFSAYTQKDWTQNIYWGWLYTLLPLFDKKEVGYPLFITNDSWQKKDLNTFFGSWTELRHDTLLYAKQSYAELGGAPGEEKPLPPVPKGYIEPNLELFSRLIALVKMTRDGLTTRELFPEQLKYQAEEFEKTLEFLKSFVEKELTDQIISDEDFEKLRLIGAELNGVLRPVKGQIITARDVRAGIIADVHTDALKGQILYEATGVPNTVYVAVKDKNGARLTRGVAYSYYEFTEPLGERLSDESWQGIAYEGKADLPSPPSWTTNFVVE